MRAWRTGRHESRKNTLRKSVRQLSLNLQSLRGNADTVGVLKDDNVRPALIDELKRNTNNRVYKDAGFCFAYTYYSASRKGKVLYETTLSTKDYE